MDLSTELHPRARQAAFNASTRDQWDGFADHRRRVSALLGAGRADEGGRLCVLGAGNTNDLDLPGLAAVYREIHLVDLDGKALAGGVSRQGVADHPAIRLHGGLDVTAMADALATWTPRTEIRPADLEALAHWPPGRVGLALPGPFDRVASTCLLSQLTDAAAHALGDDHPGLALVMEAIRRGHLRLLARLASPSGSATLITDVVSSKLLPDLATMTEAGLAGILPRIARAGTHYHGLHPSQLAAALRDDPAIGPRLKALEAVPPWIWRLQTRAFLVWAMTFRTGAGRVV